MILILKMDVEEEQQKYFRDFLKKYVSDFSSADTAFEDILLHLSVIEARKNYLLIEEGRLHHYAYYVVKGAVRSYYLKDGLEVNTWFSFENEMVGTLQNYISLPSRETIQLLEDSILIKINLNTLLPLTKTNLTISRFVRAVIEEYAFFLEDRIYYSQLRSSTERYLHLLEKDSEIFQRLSLTHIASYLGISRETLSRLRAIK